MTDSPIASAALLVPLIDAGPLTLTRFCHAHQGQTDWWHPVALELHTADGRAVSIACGPAGLHLVLTGDQREAYDLGETGHSISVHGWIGAPTDQATRAELRGIHVAMADDPPGVHGLRLDFDSLRVWLRNLGDKLFVLHPGDPAAREWETPVTLHHLP